MARRALSLFDLLCLGVNAIVGSGIYAFPGILMALLGPASTLAFAACGLISLVVAFCFAEAGARFDRSGGPYIYAREAFGGVTGYLVGWTCWAAAVISWAAVARALIPYLGHIWEPLGSGIPGTIVAVLIAAALGLNNYFGIKPGAYTTNLLTVAKLVPLFLLMVVGTFSFSAARLSPFAPHGFGTLPRATFIAFFAYQGFEVVAVPAAESTNPRRYVPLAVLSSLIGATLLYVLIQVIAVATTPGLAGAEQPLALMGRALLGNLGGQIVAAAAVISMVGFCAGVALTSPRYLEALAIDGYLPAAITRRHPRFDTPHVAILITTTTTALLIIVLDFARLIDLSVLTVAVQYLATCLAVPLLRRLDEPTGKPTGFRLPLGPTIPVLAVLIVLALVGGRLMQGDILAMVLPFVGLVGIGALAAGACKVLR